MISNQQIGGTDRDSSDRASGPDSASSPSRAAAVPVGDSPTGGGGLRRGGDAAGGSTGGGVGIIDDVDGFLRSSAEAAGIGVVSSATLAASASDDDSSTMRREDTSKSSSGPAFSEVMGERCEKGRDDGESCPTPRTYPKDVDDSDKSKDGSVEEMKSRSASKRTTETEKGVVVDSISSSTSSATMGYESVETVPSEVPEMAGASSPRTSRVDVSKGGEDERSTSAPSTAAAAVAAERSETTLSKSRVPEMASAPSPTLSQTERRLSSGTLPLASGDTTTSRTESTSGRGGALETTAAPPPPPPPATSSFRATPRGEHFDLSVPATGRIFDTVAADGRAGAVAMSPSGMGDTTEVVGEDESPAADEGSDAPIDAGGLARTFSARVVDDDEGSGAERRARGHDSSAAVQALMDDGTGTVYEGVALPEEDGEEKRDPASGWAAIWTRHKVSLGVLALAVVLVAAIATPLAITRGQSGSGAIGEAGAIQTIASDEPTSSVFPSPSPATDHPSSYPSESPTGSLAPSGSPTSERFGAIKSVILSAMAAAAPGSFEKGRDFLEDEDSPQYRALAWMVDVDERKVDPRDEKGIVQRFAVVVFYLATGGNETWADSYKILSSDHECNWHKDESDRYYDYATFTSGRYHPGVFCSEGNGTVDMLTKDDGLQGTFPEEIGLLTGLWHIRLYEENEILGTLPDSISELKSLRYLGLWGNILSGSIPSSIGRLSSLTELYLFGAHISGTMPAEMNKLTDLVNLKLGRSKLSGAVPFAAGTLTNLREFYLRGTLVRTLSPGIFTPTLTSLTLADNQFSGTLPAELWNATNLERLDLSNNSFFGPFLEAANGLPHLERLYIERNRFSSTLPKSIGFHKGLKEIHCQMNSFTGEIPSSIGELTQLKNLVLSRNKISGTVPDVWSELRDLRLLLLDVNNFSGPIPPSLAKNRYDLSRFSIANTSLTGDMGPICCATNRQKPQILADCHGNNSEVACKCCQVCCSDNDRSSQLTTEELNLDKWFGPGILRGCYRPSRRWPRSRECKSLYNSN